MPIKSNFLDFSKSKVSPTASKDYLLQKSPKDNYYRLNCKNKISEKVALHQKLELLNVEEFFDTKDPIVDRQIHSDLDIDMDQKIASLPPSDILAWIPKEYQPDKYQKTNKSKLQNRNKNSYEANIIRRKISSLLMEVGHRQFNLHNKSKSPSIIVKKIISNMQKIQRVQNNLTLQSDKKRIMIRQLQKNSKDALIFLGRTTIKQHNHNGHKCNDMMRYQRELRILVDRLSKLC